MNTVLFSVRHGETEWNLTGQQQGHQDSPLTDLGIEQAHALAAGLENKDINIIYSSDLKRAYHTAEIIAETLNLNIHTDKRLRERHLGLMQGLDKKAFTDKYPQHARHLKKNSDYVIPGGESACQHFKRCINCAENIAATEIGKRVLIVTHGGVLCNYFYKALNISLSEPRHFSLYNACINCFSILKDHWRLDTWGDTSHFANRNMLSDTVESFV